MCSYLLNQKQAVLNSLNVAFIKQKRCRQQRQTMIILKYTIIQYLMSFQHVESQKHVHGLLFEHGERGGQEVLFNPHLDHVDAADDSLDAHALGNTGPSVMQTLCCSNVLFIRGIINSSVAHMHSLKLQTSKMFLIIMNLMIIPKMPCYL